MRALSKVNAACCPRINSRSEIGFLGFRKREQVVAVVVLIVLGADELPPLTLLLAPARCHVHGFVEGVLVLDLDEGFEVFPVFRQLEALRDMQLIAVGRPVRINERPDVQTNGIDDLAL